MKNILLLGAGRSATILIDYLLKEAENHNWEIWIADVDKFLADQKTGNHAKGKAIQLNIKNTRKRRELIQKADVVISLLPVHLHYLVVKDCIKFKKHVVTASYISRDMYSLDRDVRDAAIIMMGEMGLDPGIDHMSAMHSINSLREKGARLKAFRSYTGGLVAPESDDNPWHYKFSWNPKNVILAGQGTAQYLLEGKYKYIPYNRVFLNSEMIEIPGLGKLEAYANRDSLLYRHLYKLEDIPTLIRGTLRYPGYCKAWNAFVRLGWTDDTYPIVDSHLMTYRKLLESYLPGVYHEYPKGYSLEKRLAEFLGEPVDGEVIRKLEWLGIFDNEPVKIKNASPAMILQELLVKKWILQKNDRDMVVMHHVFDYELDGRNRKRKSTLVIKGEDSNRTAMAKLVGLPLGIFVKLILMGKIRSTGVHIPVIPEFYEPVLEELETLGVSFEEEEEQT